MTDIDELKGEEVIKQKNWDSFRNNLTFQDGVNLTREVVLGIIGKNNNDSSKMLTKDILENLNEIIDQYENGRLMQLYNFFNINI